MVTDTLHLITGRIVTDDEFRERFFKQNQHTLDNYDLTSRERAVLVDMATCPMTRAALATVAMRYRQISAKVASAE